MRDPTGENEEGSGVSPYGSPFLRRGEGPRHAHASGASQDQSFGPRPLKAADLRALRGMLRDGDAGPFPPDLDDEVEYAGGSADGPTNVYYLAQYMYQVSINAVTMADHELGLLLPRSGRIWFNAALFNDIPRGRELAQRDAWWRVVDASTSVRFLLGWAVGLYRIARFRNVPHEQLPGWTRMMYFSPPLPECSRARLQLWSDVAQDVTTLFAPPQRIWRQIQRFTPMRAGERRWRAKLALANHSVNEVMSFLADRNNCPATLIQRSLDGNQSIGSYDEYLQFTEAILDDLPRLKMQRVIAMQNRGDRASTQNSGGHIMGKIPAMFRGYWASELEDPRQQVSFWRLHL